MTLNTLPPPPHPNNWQLFHPDKFTGGRIYPKNYIPEISPWPETQRPETHFQLYRCKIYLRFFFFFFKLISHQVIELRLSFTLIHLKPVLLNFSIPPFPS